VHGRYLELLKRKKKVKYLLYKSMRGLFDEDDGQMVDPQ
jgi:hypothetical protein